MRHARVVVAVAVSAAVLGGFGVAYAGLRTASIESDPPNFDGQPATNLPTPPSTASLPSVK
jgi:hypothetical protein